MWRTTRCFIQNIDQTNFFTHFNVVLTEKELDNLLQLLNVELSSDNNTTLPPQSETFTIVEEKCAKEIATQLGLLAVEVVIISHFSSVLFHRLIFLISDDTFWPSGEFFRRFFQFLNNCTSYITTKRNCIDETSKSFVRNQNSFREGVGM